jgi:hypothetical protein
VAYGDIQPFSQEAPGSYGFTDSHTGESLTYAELDARAENVAAAIAPFLTGPDQIADRESCRQNARQHEQRRTSSAAVTPFR